MIFSRGVDVLIGSPRRPGAVVGELFGTPTMDDVHHLVAVVDIRIANLSRSIASHGATIRKLDPSAYASWVSDFSNFKARYADARGEAEDWFVLPRTASTIRDDILRSLQAGY